MAFRTQKISQMTPKGANLEATDLIEVSTIESGSYVTRSITGQEIIDGIPPAAAAWGSITGTLSSQTDLQSALNAKQDTLTLTTTGTSGAATLVGSTLNIPQYSGGSSSITIGTTAITSGTVGRILFEGTGNVVQESGNLFWDNTNGRLGIGTASPANTLDVNGTIRFGTTGNLIVSSTTTELNILRQGITTFITSGSLGNAGVGTSSNAAFSFFQNNTVRAQLSTAGNLLINTTTDAGFRLDVNGSFRATSGEFGFGQIALSSNVILGFNGVRLRGSSSLSIGGVSVGNLATPQANTQLYVLGYGITSATSSLVIRNSSAVNLFIVRDNGTINAANLPTSSAGLSAGDIWNDAGTLKIV